MELNNEQKLKVKNIMDECNVSTDQAITLLIKNNWNISFAKKHYFDFILEEYEFLRSL